MWRVLVGLFVMVLFATYHAQRTPILVYVQSQYSDEFNSAVVNALRARLAATTRYTITEDPTAKTLLVGINCAELSTITHLTYPSHNSGVCAWSISYSPSDFGLPLPLLGPGFASGFASNVGEGMFQEFVKFTDDRTLSAMDQRLEEALMSAAAKKRTRP